MRRSGNFVYDVRALRGRFHQDTKEATVEHYLDMFQIVRRLSAP